MTILMTILLLINAKIAVDNWQQEIVFITLAKQKRMGTKVIANGILLFVLDISLTSGATTLFSIGVGTVGAAISMSMSNYISYKFLLPDPKYTAMIKYHIKKKKEERKLASKVSHG